ncbi:MAG: energy transducer TonB [Gemmatimonadota bacterium]|nr:energy transducer TonB [Gemmatimonadota bacterium]
MRRLRCLALLYCTAGVAAAQGSATPAHRGEIWMGFDATSGYSTIELRPMPIGDSTDALSLHIIAVFKGRVFATPQYVSVALVAETERPRFPSKLAVSIVAEGAVVYRAPVQEVLRLRSPTDGKTIERVAFRMPIAAVNGMTSGHVAIIAGAGRIALSDDNVAALREYASRLTVVGYTRAVAAAQASTARGAVETKKEWYEPTQVDEFAAPTLLPEHPKYPAEIPAEERVRREFIIEFVVDTAGYATLRTAKSTTGGQVGPFVEAIKAAMAKWEYAPAKKDGKPVAQIVRQIITFPAPSAQPMRSP